MGKEARTRNVWRQRRKRREVIFLVLAGLMLCATIVVQILKPAGRSVEVSAVDGRTQHNEGSRVKRAIELSATEEPQNCTKRSVEEFPPDLFTLEQKQRYGLIFLHCLGALYMFSALAIVCDDYFVPSLEHICTRLGLSPDVAGATFMAAGSSAPELATSIIGVFIAQSDVGLGTIVGSAVFNILIIVAMCSLFAGMVIPLTWWPLFRDCSYYALSVIVLTVVIQDGEVHWYEALIMFTMYILYVTFMYFNPRVSSWAIAKVHEFQHRRGHFPGNLKGHAGEESAPLLGEDAEKSSVSFKSGETETHFGGENSATESEDDEDFESPWTVPESFLKRFYWVAMLPVSALLFLTVPDSRRGGVWKRLFLLSFIMSVVWISGFSYVMVWMVAIMGDTWNIPDAVMGLTILAAGTSVPDAMSSLFVARDGFGDMAISNSVGSNIFDILLCLGLPWMIECFRVGAPVDINSKTIVFTSISLLATVIFLLVAVAVNGWKLNKKFGIICLFVYVVFMLFSCMYELNVFGEINFPSCPRNFV
ncbi:sodium/potassium/calcium exchanger 3 [Lingula anatina]|uniref:Sodium/potassium/calcium exchanger 3 n=2 Tax=Lingula anatina TaxID=7574 RepID=A0A1S3H8R1_LINAN|nr:sodium/potassium/calcium exchanger 3 [Lingula anatina]|eukprot:XP_013382398.1 sodium/potassium/calcium exchanger 3 [Lingula anatina]